MKAWGSQDFVRSALAKRKKVAKKLAPRFVLEHSFV